MIHETYYEDHICLYSMICLLFSLRKNGKVGRSTLNQRLFASVGSTLADQIESAFASVDSMFADPR